MLGVDLTALEAMPVRVDRLGQSDVYDPATLDDPTHANANGIDDELDRGHDGLDANEPFSADEGRREARIVLGGSVQVCSPGDRNVCDVTLTEPGRLYTSGDRPSDPWGGTAMGEGAATLHQRPERDRHAASARRRVETSRAGP